MKYSYVPKGFENLMRNFEADGLVSVRRPMIITEHDYNDIMQWTTQEFAAVTFDVPRDNVEGNCR